MKLGNEPWRSAKEHAGPGSSRVQALEKSFKPVISHQHVEKEIYNLNVNPNHSLGFIYVGAKICFGKVNQVKSNDCLLLRCPKCMVKIG